MAPQGMQQPGPWPGQRNFTGPAGQHLAPHRCQSYPFGQPLSIDLPSQHPEPDQPDQLIFAAVHSGKAAAEAVAVAAAGQLITAQSLQQQQVVEGAAVGQAWQGLTRPGQGAGR